MVDIKPTKFPENVIQVSDIGEGEYLSAAREKLIRLHELEDKFYETHAVRRVLRKLHFLASPDNKARAWALQRYEEEQAK
ncbi:MAG: hypothetical protein WCD07_01135 [Burkholderiales bacterium]